MGYEQKKIVYAMTLPRNAISLFFTICEISIKLVIFYVSNSLPYKFLYSLDVLIVILYSLYDQFVMFMISYILEYISKEVEFIKL